jgi:hypothetical protein
MNRRKNTSSLGFSSLVLLAIAVGLVSASGIVYVMMKNKQVTARSQIAEVQKRMAAHEVSITLYQSDIEEMLGYFRLSALLVAQKSKITEIRFVEVYQSPDEERPAQDSVVQK